MSLQMHSSIENNRHTMKIFDQPIHIGLFRSTPVEVRVHGDIASTTSRLLSQVDEVSILTDSFESGIVAKRTFRVGAPVSGMRSRFQWYFFGELTSEGTVVVVRGAFQLPRLLTIYYAIWFIVASLFIVSTTVVAATSDLPETWLLPIVAIIITAGGFATLLIGRALSEPAIHKTASQLERCLGPGLRT